jgi:uncharacterized protein (UPF0335 family)
MTGNCAIFIDDEDVAPLAAAPPSVREADVGGIAADRLRSFIERIERLEEEKKGIADDIKEIYSEAKGTGFEPRILRQVIRLRKKEQAERREEEELIELYKAALGMAD